MIAQIMKSFVIIQTFILSSCTYLNDVHRADYWYRSPVSCAQGPFEIRIPVRGDSWGEKLTLQVYAPRKVAFRVDFRTSTEEEFHKSFIGSEAQMDNQECLAPETDSRVSSPEAPSGKSSTVAGVPEPAAPVDGGSAPLPAPAAPSVQLERINPNDTSYQSRPSAKNPLVDTNIAAGEMRMYTLSLFDAQRHEIEGPPPFAKGTEFIIRIWSVLPNDLRNVSFLLEHRQYKPEPSEKKYVAKLKKEQREREKAMIERQRKAEKRAQKRLREEERRRRKMAAAGTVHQPPRKASKPRKYSQLACVTGRYKGRRVQICRKFTSLDEYMHCIGQPRDIQCWHVPRKGRWHYYIAEAPRPQPDAGKPQPRPADGPPPSPRDEMIPPKPSLNATWVPGYWKWSGFSWVWLFGFWRVPESDLQEEKTVVAPADPPPPKEEEPSFRPIEGAVWSAGYWHWDGHVWVWVPGRWMLAPQQGQTWVPASWRRTPRGIILVPGHWRRR